MSSRSGLWMLFLVISLAAILQVTGNGQACDHISIRTGITDSLELESNLPIIVINTFGVPIPDEPKITGYMGIIDNGPGNLNNLQDPFTNYDGVIGIEVRGQSSQMFPKKSYALETRDSTGENLDAPLLGLPAENDWVLYAPYSDKSMLRNVVSFEIGHRTGQYCTRSVFCELVVNDEYVGVYTLMEKIKQDENRVDIATLNPDEITGDELTGGYIIKVDKIDWDFVYGIDGWKSDPAPPYPNAKDIIFQYYYPEPDELADQQRDYIKDFITAAENTLTYSNFINPDFGYQKFFDMLSFIDYMIVCEIPKEVDKYRYSTYFYKEKDSDGGKLFAGPAWDFDLGYGNVDYWLPGVDYSGWLYPTVEPVDWSIIFWWKRLMEDPYFRDLAKTRWTWLRADKLNDEAFHTFIDSVVVHLDEARDRNFERWPILGEYVWPNYNWYGNTYEDEVDYFETFLFNRLQWMDYNFPGNIITPKAGIFADAGKITVHLYDDYFCRKDLEIENFQLNNAPEGVIIQGVEYFSASECYLHLSADVSGYPQVSVTVGDEVVNYWQDLTSNALGAQGAGDLAEMAHIMNVFSENHMLHVIFRQAEQVPEYAEIVNLAGQGLGRIHLQKQCENRIPHQLNPGMYLFVFKTGETSTTRKFSVFHR